MFNSPNGAGSSRKMRPKKQSSDLAGVIVTLTRIASGEVGLSSRENERMIKNNYRASLVA